ncbi:MAG: hypothetical protein ACI9BD_000229 [Candidatus Marinamargulisbacteria bacterium]|jgi:hypothetical protein
MAILKILFVFFLFPLSIIGADFEASHSVTPGTVAIGDKIRYSINVTYNRQIQFYKPELVQGDRKEIVFGEAKMDQKVIGDTYILKIDYDLVVFNIGHLIIPTRNLLYQEGESIQTFQLSPIPVQIVSVATGNNAQMRPIKAPMKISISWRQYLIPGLLLGFLVLLVSTLLYRRFFRSEKTGPSPVIDPVLDFRSAKEKAKEALQELEKKQLLEKGYEKAHYLCISEILRAFFSAVFHKKMLEMTTHEVMQSLAAISDEQTCRRIGKVLVLSDRVKFSKYRASDEEHKKTLSLAYEILERAEKVEAVS